MLRTLKQFKYPLLLAAAVCCMASAVQAQDKLADLVQQGMRRQAMELIRLGADVDAPQTDGSTALHWAVFQSDVELTNLLLSHEADANVRNVFDATPLAEAVKLGNYELVKALLEAGADPDSPNGDGQTALMLSTTTGIFPIAELLVEHGANVNAVEAFRNQNALMWAAANGQADIVRLLVDNGADVNLRSTWTDWQSQITSEPRAQYRLTGGLTPLLYAARSGCTECLEAILDAGADIDLPDPDGVTALMIAIDNSAFDAARFLLERGANPHPWDWWGRTALYIAADMSSYGGAGYDRFGRGMQVQSNVRATTSAIDIMRLLLEAGVNPDSQLNQHRPGRGGGNGRFADDLLNTGATPLLVAANSQDAEAIRVLVEYGADIDLPNAMGVTPFLAAAGFGAVRGRLGDARYADSGREAKALESVKILVEAGADIHATVKDTTSLTARVARISTMSDRDGQTALFSAVYQSWPTVVQYLIDQGLDIHHIDDQGKTIWDMAMANAGGRLIQPLEPMVKLVEELGVKPGPNTDVPSRKN